MYTISIDQRKSWKKKGERISDRENRKMRAEVQGVVQGTAIVLAGWSAGCVKGQ